MFLPHGGKSGNVKALLFSHVIDSAAYKIPEEKGASQTSPYPREGRPLSHSHIASQQCTEDSNPDLFTLLECCVIF